MSLWDFLDKATGWQWLGVILLACITMSGVVALAQAICSRTKCCDRECK